MAPATLFKGVQLAFEKHATGWYSDTQIAHVLNEKGYLSVYVFGPN
jgi:hypothetical protein